MVEVVALTFADGDPVPGRDDKDAAALRRRRQHRLPGLRRVLLTGELIEDHQGRRLTMAGRLRRRQGQDRRDTPVRMAYLDRVRRLRTPGRLQHPHITQPGREALVLRPDPPNQLRRLLLVDRHRQHPRARTKQEMPQREPTGQPGDPQLAGLQHNRLTAAHPPIENIALPVPATRRVIEMKAELLARLRVDTRHMPQKPDRMSFCFPADQLAGGELPERLLTSERGYDPLLARSRSNAPPASRRRSASERSRNGRLSVTSSVSTRCVGFPST